MRTETAKGVILADDADYYSILRNYNWHVTVKADGRLYAQTRINNKRVSMHRLLMNPPAGMVVHHKNNNGLDNRRDNLMVTTQRVNIRFAYIGKNCVHQQNGQWRAQVRDETGKQVSLGMYANENEARSVVQNWNYRKMLELENIGDTESLQLAEVLSQCL